MNRPVTFDELIEKTKKSRDKLRSFKLSNQPQTDFYKSNMFSLLSTDETLFQKKFFC